MPAPIASVILWANGQVMVFDSDDAQMPEYQGPLFKVHAAILRDASPETTWHIGVWGAGTIPMSREQFSCWRFQ